MNPKSKLGIVIPTYNSERFLKDSIMSIATQEVDHSYKVHLHIQDGGSTDKTIKIIHGFTQFAWRENFSYSYASEPDKGMYDALNRGFTNIDSEVMTYLGSDDVLHPSSIQTAITFLEGNPFCDWLTGHINVIDETGVPILHLEPQGFPHTLLSSGLFDGRHNTFVMQEGTFWTRAIWREVGQRFNDKLMLAGDFDLWVRFSQRHELVQLDTPLAAHRKRRGQLSGNLTEYYLEVDEILSKKVESKSEKVFSKFGLISFWNEADRTWTTSSAAGEKFWKGQVDFVINSQGVFKEGPHPEKGIYEKCFWVGSSVELSLLGDSAVFSKARYLKIRIVNTLHENRAKVRYAGLSFDFNLINTVEIQEVFISAIPPYKQLVIESKKTKKEFPWGKKFGFKVLSIELIT
jgi:glycosyltransferase involved in cell wall biosynthesis